MARRQTFSSAVDRRNFHSKSKSGRPLYLGDRKTRRDEDAEIAKIYRGTTALPNRKPASDGHLDATRHEIRPETSRRFRKSSARKKITKNQLALDGERAT
jgi:hypothetical protein